MKNIPVTPAEFMAVRSIVATNGSWADAAELMGYPRSSRGSVSNLVQSACRRLGISPNELLTRCRDGRLLLNGEAAGRLTVRAAMIDQQLKAQACAASCKSKARR